MNIHQATKRFEQIRVRPETLSFYADSPDTYYSLCDISCAHCMCVSCTALDIDGTTVHLDIAEELVSGSVGKLAGAF